MRIHHTMSTRATIMLAGQQEARIDVHGAREEGARLSVVWGTLLLTVTAADQAHALREAFADARIAAQRIPAAIDPAILAARIGNEAYLPTIAVTYIEPPRCAISSHSSGANSPGGWAHQQHWLHIKAGVVLFRVFDQAAHASTVELLSNAAAVADSTLPAAL